MRQLNPAAILILCFCMFGCAGGEAIDDGVPQAALKTPSNEPLPPPSRPEVAVNESSPSDGMESAGNTAPPPPPNEAVSSGSPRSTGAFPNINEEPAPSTYQMSDAERDQLLLQMQALQKAHQSGDINTAAYQRRLLALQRLAQSHSRETIRRIEAD